MSSKHKIPLIYGNDTANVVEDFDEKIHNLLDWDVTDVGHRRHVQIHDDPNRNPHLSTRYPTCFLAGPAGRPARDIQRKGIDGFAVF